MRKRSDSRDKIAVVTVDEVEGARSVRGMWTRRLEIDTDQLAVNISVFLDQMGEVMSRTPDSVGRFQLAEVEVSAEITGKGQVVLWGVGGEVEAGGGIKFVFKKQPLPAQ